MPMCSLPIGRPWMPTCASWWFELPASAGETRPQDLESRGLSMAPCGATANGSLCPGTEDDRMNESSSVQEGEMTGGSTVADNDPFIELLVLKWQLNSAEKKRAQAEKECKSPKESFRKIFADDQLRYLGKAKVATFKAKDRYAVIMLDEMQLTPGLDYDFTTSSVIGSGDQAIWELRSIMATKYGRPRTTCVHPCDESRNLHFLADAPHLLKNLRGHLVRQQKIVLDDETVVKNKLPTNEVKYNVAM
ncbi:hypothetical protein HPB51_013596 [Rhipicephalus microplus]|uniref:Uncharacterized protein n=1 Tax=Rhipicephalus microplus TaxID=6941 RepID=A0A9J6DUP4_RHIMP|nr:hypothetical protein HPB51_013596 [Rhipicephalus microplus]